MVAHVPRKNDLSRYYESDFLDNYQGWNESPHTIDTINSKANIVRARFANQEQ